MDRISSFYRQMYDLSNEGYKVIDKDFNIVSCNKKYAEFNNLENKQEIIGKKCRQYLCSKNCGTEKCSLLKILRKEKKFETTIENKIGFDGTKYYLLNVQPFENEENEVIGIVECYIDITSVKKAELALKESEARLKKNNAAKDKLFSIIAHDLRSPFSGILGVAELLLENINNLKTEETREYVKNIQASARHTLFLLNNLLSWAKTQTGDIIMQPETINLLSVIRETIEISKASNFKNISLNYNLPENIEVLTDREMLKIVLRNLISNALKFTKTRGEINISAITKQNKVEITVSDNGVGMNDETRKKLFNSYTNVTLYGTENEKGSGLGLVLCKEFIEKLGGTIWVESKEDVGSVFKFTLPLGEA